MLGAVDLGGFRLVFEDDRTWHCPEAPSLAATANAMFSIERYSPADGQIGARQVSEAAEFFGGTAIIPTAPKPRPLPGYRIDGDLAIEIKVDLPTAKSGEAIGKALRKFRKGK